MTDDKHRDFVQHRRAEKEELPDEGFDQWHSCDHVYLERDDDLEDGYPERVVLYAAKNGRVVFQTVLSAESQCGFPVLNTCELEPGSGPIPKPPMDTSEGHAKIALGLAFGLTLLAGSWSGFPPPLVFVAMILGGLLWERL